jgi:hypothetical protein
MEIFAFFEALAEKEFHYIILVIIVFLFLKMIFYEGNKYLTIITKRANNIELLIAMVKNAIADPKNPERVINRIELIEKIDEIHNEQLKIIGKVCLPDNCIFKAEMLEKIEEVEDKARVLLDRMILWEEGSRSARQETQQSIQIITDDVRKVSHELLTLVRTLLDRLANGKS